MMHLDLTSKENSIDEQGRLSRQDRLLAMGHMAACLAHEMRNPLGSMELYGSLLKRELAENENAISLLQPMLYGIRTLTHIIENCLQFTKDVTPKRVTLSGLAESTGPASFLSETAEFVKNGNSRKIAIDCNDIGEFPIDIDVYLVGQVLLNLLTNAIDAVPLEIDPELSVVIDRTHSEYWKLSVSDNGSGIPPERLESIFDPFYTTKEKGTGLGLAIVSSIVAAHEGELSISSKVGDGTKIVIQFKNR